MTKRTAFRLAALAIVPALLAAAEIYLQIRHARKATPTTTAWTEPDDALGFRLRRNFRTPDGFASNNASGFRGDSAHVPSMPGRPRILVLGNSCVYGIGVRDTETFSAVLEERLRASGETEAVVLNAGVPGYNSEQVALYLESALDAFHPTHVVVYVGWNDLVTATWPFTVPHVQLGPKYLPPAPLLWRAIESSRLFWSLRSHARGLQLLLRADGGRDTWNADYIRNYHAQLERIGSWIAAHHARAIWCLLPYDPARAPDCYSYDAFKYTPTGYRALWSAFQAEIRRAAGTTGTIADLPSAMAGRESALFIDYNHMTPEGHRIAAEEILRAVRATGPGGT